MNQAAVDLIARALVAGLFHPGDENRPSSVIPTPFRTTGMSDEQAQHLIGASARMWAEAIVYLIEGDHEILTKPDAQQLRQDAADAPDGTRIVTLYDRADYQHKTPLLMLTIGKTDYATVDATLLRKLAQNG